MFRCSICSEEYPDSHLGHTCGCSKKICTNCAESNTDLQIFDQCQDCFEEQEVIYDEETEDTGGMVWRQEPKY